MFLSSPADEWKWSFASCNETLPFVCVKRIRLWGFTGWMQQFFFQLFSVLGFVSINMIEWFDKYGFKRVFCLHQINWSLSDSEPTSRTPAVRHICCQGCFWILWSADTLRLNKLNQFNMQETQPWNILSLCHIIHLFSHKYKSKHNIETKNMKWYRAFLFTI